MQKHVANAHKKVSKPAWLLTFYLVEMMRIELTTLRMRTGRSRQVVRFMPRNPQGITGHMTWISFSASAPTAQPGFLSRTNSWICPLNTSSFSCTIFLDRIYLPRSEWCVVTSFYQSQQATSLFLSLFQFAKLTRFDTGKHSDNCGVLSEDDYVAKKQSIGYLTD